MRRSVLATYLVAVLLACALVLGVALPWRAIIWWPHFGFAAWLSVGAIACARIDESHSGRRRIRYALLPVITVGFYSALASGGCLVLVTIGYQLRWIDFAVPAFLLSAALVIYRLTPVAVRGGLGGMNYVVLERDG